MIDALCFNVRSVSFGGKIVSSHDAAPSQSGQRPASAINTVLASPFYANALPQSSQEDNCLTCRVTEEGKQAMITERRPATTIGELDIHLGFIMDELRGLRKQQEDMLAMLATKRELDDKIAALNKRIDEESATMFFNKIRNVATWVTVIAAAAGVVIAFARHA